MKSVVRGRRRPFAILAVALVVAGCGATTVQTTTDSVSASGRLAFLETASRSSAVLVDVVRPSFQASEFETASATARHATGSVPGKDVRFTADASVVKDRNYRLMFAFDPLPGVTGNDVCRARARALNTDRRRDGTRLFAAFCYKGEAIGGAKVSGPALKGPNDPAYAKMVRAAVSAIFPAAGPGSADIDDGRTLDSIQLSPRPRFRFNPLDGIIN